MVYALTWVGTLLCLALALWSFVSITHDADRKYYAGDGEGAIFCTHTGVDFETVSPLATGSKDATDTDLQSILIAGSIVATLLAMVAMAEVARADIDIDTAPRKTKVAVAVVTGTLLVYVFASLGFAFTAFLTTTCSGDWGSPKFAEYAVAALVLMAYGGMASILARNTNADAADTNPVKQLNMSPTDPVTLFQPQDKKNVPYFSLALVLVFQFAVAYPFYKDVEFSGGNDPRFDCTSAESNDKAAWVILLVALGCGVVWAVLTIVLVVARVPQAHQANVRKANICFCVLRMALFPIALTLVFLSRIEDVQCLGLLHHLWKEEAADTKMWEVFALVLSDCVLFLHGTFFELLA